MNEDEEVIRDGRWIKSEHVGDVKRSEDGYGTDSIVFDTDCLKGIERVEMEMIVLRKCDNRKE